MNTDGASSRHQNSLSATPRLDSFLFMYLHQISNDGVGAVGFPAAPKFTAGDLCAVFVYSGKQRRNGGGELSNCLVNGCLTHADGVEHGGNGDLIGILFR